MADEEELGRLRERAELAGIVDVEGLKAGQLKIALAERHRGADPKQARDRATSTGE